MSLTILIDKHITYHKCIEKYPITNKNTSNTEISIVFNMMAIIC